MMDSILDTILKDIYAFNRLRHCLRVLKSYFVKSFFGEEKETETLSPQDVNWLSSLPKDFYQTFNKDNVYQIFENLETAISQLQVLIIYLSFETNDQTIIQIGSFARSIFNSPRLILDTKYDPNLIAGCALTWKGVYRDYSLKVKIAQQKSEILESFKKFLR